MPTKSGLGRSPIVLRSAAAFRSSKLEVDREAGVLRNVSIISKGPALGHNFNVDDTMLRQVAAMINAKSKGVKSRLAHPGVPDCGGSDGIETLLGRVKNARVEGDQVLGDAHLCKFAAKSPSGDLRSYVMDVAEEDPEIMGLSIAFLPDDFEEQDNPDDPDKPLQFGRCKDVMAADFVGDPAANAGGLLSRLPHTVLSSLPHDFLGRWLTAAGLIDLIEGGDAAEPAAVINQAVREFLDKLAQRHKPTDAAARPAAPTSTPGTASAPKIVPPYSGGGPMDPKLKQHLVTLGLDPNATDGEAKAFLSALSRKKQAVLAAAGLAAAFEAVMGRKPETEETAPVVPPTKAPASPAAPKEPAVAPIVDHLADDRERQKFLGQLETMYKLGEEFTLAQIVALAGTPQPEFHAAAKKAALDHLAAKNPPIKVRVGEDKNIGTLASAMGDAVSLRAGNKLYETDADGRVVYEKLADGSNQPKQRPPHPRAREFKSLSLMEMAKAHLSALGVNTVGLSRQEVAGLVFNKGRLAGRIGTTFLSEATGDFPGILGDTINKTLRAAYMVAPVTWDQWARRNMTPDFKIITRLQLSETDLRSVAPGGEYQETNLTESKEQYKLSKYGRIISITWETIINDDLNAFGEVPRKMGNACRRKEDEVTYAVLSSNQTMQEDTLALFHTTHGNLTAGAGAAWYMACDADQYDTVEVCFLEGEAGPVFEEENGFDSDKRRYKVRHVVAAHAIDFRGLYKSKAAISIASLDTGRQAIATQKDIAGKDFLALDPRILIVSTANEIATKQLINSPVDPTKSNATPNPFQGSFKIVASPRVSG